MRNKYLYIEPYVIANYKKDKLLLHNTYTNKTFDYIFTAKESMSFLDSLFKDNLSRVIELPRQRIPIEFIEFIKQLRYTYCGDIYIGNTTPLLFDQYPKVNKDLRNSNVKKSWENLNIRLSTKELIICVSDNSIHIKNKKLLNYGYKQISFPVIHDKNIAKDHFSKISEYFNHEIKCLVKLNILGNIFANHSNFGNLTYLFNSIVNLNVHYKSIDACFLSKYKLIDSPQNTLVIWFDEINLKGYLKIVKEIMGLGSNIKLKIVISNEDDLKNILNIQPYLENEYDLVPFYDNNLTFFRKHIFNKKGDILDQNLSERQIYSKLFLNYLNFGKIYILQNGDLYGNLNFSKVGNIYKTNYITVLKKLHFNVNQAWLLTRTQVNPCRDCIYSFMCNPISNYEIFTGTFNFCYYNLVNHKWE